MSFQVAIVNNKMATRRKSKDYEAANSFAEPKNMVPENMQSKFSFLFACLLSNIQYKIQLHMLEFGEGGGGGS